MVYFQNINDLEQAKLHYRTLAKQLHPDKEMYEVEPKYCINKISQP